MEGQKRSVCDTSLKTVRALFLAHNHGLGTEARMRAARARHMTFSVLSRLNSDTSILDLPR